MYCFWKIFTAITLYRHLTLTLFNISQPQPNITDIISLIVFSLIIWNQPIQILRSYR